MCVTDQDSRQKDFCEKGKTVIQINVFFVKT